MANDEPNAPAGTCGRCERSTPKKCLGCLEAPNYTGHDSETTFYCDSTCQKADWEHHKSKCRQLQVRKTLRRAALLLKAVFYRIRLHAHPLVFKTLRLDGSSILLEGPHPFARSKRLLKPFPVRLDSEEGPAEAVLAYEGCAVAMMYLQSFAEELLSGRPIIPFLAFFERDTKLLV